MSSADERQQLVEDSEWPNWSTQDFVKVAVLAEAISLGFQVREERLAPRQTTVTLWKCSRKECSWEVQIKASQHAGARLVYTKATPSRHSHRFDADDPSFKAWVKKADEEVEAAQKKILQEAVDVVKRFKKQADFALTFPKDKRDEPGLATPATEQQVVVCDVARATSRKEARALEAILRQEKLMADKYPVESAVDLPLPSLDYVPSSSQPSGSDDPDDSASENRSGKKRRRLPQGRAVKTPADSGTTVVVGEGQEAREKKRKKTVRRGSRREETPPSSTEKQKLSDHSPSPQAILRKLAKPPRQESPEDVKPDKGEESDDSVIFEDSPKFSSLSRPKRRSPSSFPPGPPSYATPSSAQPQPSPSKPSTQHVFFTADPRPLFVQQLHDLDSSHLYSTAFSRFAPALNALGITSLEQLALFAKHRAEDVVRDVEEEMKKQQSRGGGGRGDTGEGEGPKKYELKAFGIALETLAKGR